VHVQNRISESFSCAVNIGYRIRRSCLSLAILNLLWPANFISNGVHQFPPDLFIAGLFPHNLEV
jgi:hypothetical protein